MLNTLKTAFLSANSARLSLPSGLDLAKVLRAIVVAMLGAGLLALAKAIAGVDFGEYNLIAQAVTTGLIELARRFAAGQ
jgi:hypothetical protein